MGPKLSPNKKKSPKKITERLKLETQDIERFILCIKNHPVLYDTALHDYKNGQVQAQARATIAAQFYCTPAEVKDTWQSFKDRYTKERKMLNKQPPSGSHATPSRTPSWFYKQMDFLDKHIKQRQRQSNCGDTSDVSTAECASVVRKEMPHEVIEDIETAPEGFQPDEIETFCISEEYAQNSAAPDDEDDDWMNDMSTINSTTGDTNSTASASNVADFDRDVFKTPSPACNKNSTSSGNGVTHGFSEIASPSGEKPFRKKRKLEDGDAALQQSMVNTLDALSSSLRNKTKSVQEDERSKTRNNDPVYDELLQYCSNFARRLADIPNEKSRERIRHAMEMAMFEHKFK